MIPTYVGRLPGAGATAVLLAARGPGPCPACGARIVRGQLVVYARHTGGLWCLACADGLAEPGTVPPWRVA